MNRMEFTVYMGKANFEKALNSLTGIIKGIQADESINHKEIDELQNWCLLQYEYVNRHPFKEIIPLVKDSIQDGILTVEEVEDILWLCSSYVNTNPYYDAATSGIVELQGIIHGILSDGAILKEELYFLREWLQQNDILETIYPYDEVYALVHEVLKDGHVSIDEEKFLKAFFADFIDHTSSVNINKGELVLLKEEMNISGICTLGPNIILPGKTFCFTGESSKIKRSEIADIIIANGGLYRDNVLKQTDYLIVGDGGNPCWAFSCYGRKIEKAINYRKQGQSLIIAHEVDFWDALG